MREMEYQVFYFEGPEHGTSEFWPGRPPVDIYVDDHRRVGRKVTVDRYVYTEVFGEVVNDHRIDYQYELSEVDYGD